MSQPVQVTRTHLPDLEKYIQHVREIWDSHCLTNGGPKLQLLEKRLEEYLKIQNLSLVGNGTLALQLAIQALEIKDEIITTPFSYVATMNSILWEGCTPKFVDISPDDLCINADQIEKAVTSKTKAILAVHTYGFPCDVKKISALAKDANLKTIYDGAHAFGVKVSGKSLLACGDITTVSLHATKVFHSAEGGLIYSSTPDLNDKIKLLRAFGHKADDYFCVGMNAKLSELHAAMGLCVLENFEKIVKERKRISSLYDQSLLFGKLRKPAARVPIEYNYGYYPVIFPSEKSLLTAFSEMREHNIFPRRYFFPALNTLKFAPKASMPVAEEMARRILCLPLFENLAESVMERISTIINRAVKT